MTREWIKTIQQIEADIIKLARIRTKKEKGEVQNLPSPTFTNENEIQEKTK